MALIGHPDHLGASRSGVKGWRAVIGQGATSRRPPFDWQRCDWLLPNAVNRCRRL